MEKACHRDNIYIEMDALHNQAVYPLTDSMAKKYEDLDNKIEQLMEEAEKQCRKLHTGDIPWSPAYKKACLILTYWYMRKDHSLGLHTNVRQIITLQNKLSIVYNPNLTLVEIIQDLKGAHKQRKRVKKMANELSLEYRLKLAMVKEEAGELKAAVFLRNQNRIEEQRRVARNIRRTEGKMKGGSTTKVTVVDVDGNSTHLVNRKEIEMVMAKGNEALGHQTEGGSQLLTPAYTQSLGHHGEGTGTDSVLQGTYNFPPDTTDDTRDFILACKYKPQVQTVLDKDDIKTRYQKTKQLWSIRKEKTCTYGKHMGHYKAVMRHDWLSWLFFQ